MSRKPRNKQMTEWTTAAFEKGQTLGREAGEEDVFANLFDGSDLDVLQIQPRSGFAACHAELLYDLPDLRNANSTEALKVYTAFELGYRAAVCAHYGL